MKRYLLIILGVMFSMLTYAQTDPTEYDPSNPPDPTWPEEVLKKYYTITCEAIPYGAGSFSYNEKAEAGKMVSVTAYSHNSCDFVCWQDAEGNQLTTNRTYSFTMPAENITLYAVYNYQPENPADPQFVGQYMLNVKSKPEVAGTFNLRNQKVAAGSVQSLYAYENSGFKFLHWEDEDGNVISSIQSNMQFIMPSHACTLTAVYEYDPANPANPGTNLWNPISGELSMDFFKSGSLVDAMNTMVGGNREKVTHLIVDGVITNNDMGFVRNFTKLTYIDLSRVEGINTIPAGIWQNNTDVKEIEIPSCITQIGYNAFDGCSALDAIDCYAAVPPTLGKNALANLPAGMVVFVPESSVDIYKATEGWNQFTIAPLRNKICALEVSLPEACSDGRYKNMTLEIINEKSGQKNKYVITDRLTYTFPTLVRNTQYRIYVTNLSGYEIAVSDVIDVDDEVVKYAFNLADMSSLKTVSMKIMAQGKDVTDKVNIVWTDATAGYLKNGNSLAGQLVGSDLICQLTLPKDLALEYQQPDLVEYKVKDNGNEIIYSLETLPEVTLKGRVVSAMTGNAIAGANIAISQLLNGKYTDVITTSTDAQGYYTVKVHKAQSDVAISSSEYITLNWSDGLYNAVPGEVFELGTFKLKNITGVVANVSFTYQESVFEGKKAEPTFFTDTKNVSYTLFNISKGQSITNFSVQHPKIVVIDGATAGDKVSVTCHSLTDAFGDVTVSDVVNENNQLSIVFPLVQRGAVYARFLVTDNVRVDGILYDAEGKLMDRATYNTNYTAYEYELGDEIRHDNTPNFVYFPGLADGKYTLVTMGQSDYFNSVYSLSNLASAGLTEGVDYVKNEITVKGGRIEAIRNVVVPVFDESKFYYTGSNTAFTVNRPSVTVGNYLTLSAKVDFLDAFKLNVSDVELLVNLPQNCNFVDGSVILGNNITSYEYRNNTVVVPLGENFTDRVKFCIVPMARGNYSPDAFVRFKLNGKTVIQPIGSANYKSTDLTIWAEPLISTPNLFIDGNAPGQSEISVYDGKVLIGTTKALSDGYWSLQTKVHQARNMSMHSIKAYVKTPAGLDLETESRFVEYNKAAIDAKSVNMTFFNNSVNRTITVDFDLEHHVVSSKNYQWAPAIEFVFTADLTNNDPEVVHSCKIRVFTVNHEWITLDAQYIPNLDRWVAHSKFTSDQAPMGVRVSVDADLSSSVDIEDIEDANAIIASVPEVIESIKQTVAQYEEPALDLAEDIEPEEADDELDPEEEAQNVQTSTQNTEEYICSEQFALDLAEEYPVANVYRTDYTICEDGERFEYFVAPVAQVDLSKYDDDKIETKVEEDKTSVVTYYAADGSMVIVDDTKAVGIAYRDSDPDAIESKPRKAPGTTTYITELKKNIAELSDAANVLTGFAGLLDAMLNSQLTSVQIQIGASKANIAHYKAEIAAHPEKASVYKPLIVAETLNLGKLYAEEAKDKAGLAEIQKMYDLANDLADMIAMAHDAEADLRAWDAFIDGILPCNGPDDARARGLYATASAQYASFANKYIKLTATATMAAKILSDSSNTASLSAFTNAVSAYVHDIAKGNFNSNKKESSYWLNKDKKERNSFHCNYPGLEEVGDVFDPSIPYPITTPIIDPAGYVYEGVASNRLEGVTATAYYKTKYEDMYGDLHEDIVLWDAAEYSQENPLFTDENGMYQWDVPQGLWQVKFEKEGYVTAYSEWLPVPPPQMDVNIGLVQRSQPEVVGARAFSASANNEAGIELTFSKYMRPASLNADNIYVKGVKNNEETLVENLKFSYPDKEVAIEGSEDSYAQKVIVATGDLSAYDEVYVVVSSMVESYAGVNMTQTYEQKLDIEKRIMSIGADSLVSIAYEGNAVLKIGALPTEAAAGKQIRIRTASAMIATLGDDAKEEMILTLNADGQAEVKVNGVLFGSTALQYEVVNDDVKATSLIAVVDPALLAEVELPVASRIDGTAVFRGQSVSLSCPSEGAKIYYTLDGSCPCESATRKLYQGPIVINDAMNLKIMSVGTNGDESEVREYNYTIRQSSVSLDLAEGWNWASHDVAAPVSADAFKSVVYRIQTQTEELINDPVLGFVGSVSSIDPTVAVKLETKAAATKTFVGEQYNPSVSDITLVAGWNWLGYPIDQTLTLGDAFKYLAAEEGDVVTNIEGGFAEFTDGQWTGTLTALVPGQGYLYKSGSNKNFIYNIVPTVNAKAISQRRAASAPKAPWTVNPHLYPSMMSITADLFADARRADADEYFVGAFVGDECRGIGKYVDGKLYISVHGDKAEAVTFKAVDAQGFEHSIAESVTFTADVLGSSRESFALNLGEATAINGIAVDGKAGDVYDVTGCKVANPSKGVYIMNGNKLIIK